MPTWALVCRRELGLPSTVTGWHWGCTAVLWETLVHSSAAGRPENINSRGGMLVMHIFSQFLAMAISVKV